MWFAQVRCGLLFTIINSNYNQDRCCCQLNMTIFLKRLKRYFYRVKELQGANWTNDCKIWLNLLKELERYFHWTKAIPLVNWTPNSSLLSVTVTVFVEGLKTLFSLIQDVNWIKGSLPLLFLLLNYGAKNSTAHDERLATSPNRWQGSTCRTR